MDTTKEINKLAILRLWLLAFLLSTMGFTLLKSMERKISK
jgi:hypothetical protein